MSRLVVVSNRVAKMDSSNTGSQGGLAVGVMAAMGKAGGLWFGWSGKVENRDDIEPKIETQGNIDYATVSLKTAEYNLYYKGFANSVLWPLFHQRPDLMMYDANDYRGYLEVNEKIAKHLLPLLRPDDTIWIHDYHLIPLGKMLRDAGVTSPIGFFLHTPFPPLDLLRTVPDYKDILLSLMSYDLVGFQTQADYRGFYMSVTYGLKGKALPGDRYEYQGYSCTAGVYPISIETDALRGVGKTGEASEEFKRLHYSLADRQLIIGVDRLDYSKGLEQRLLAYERLLRKYPEFLRSAVYLQIAPTSRGDVEAYKDLAKKIDRHVGHIVGTYADFDWVPLRYLNRGFRRNTILAMYNLASVGYVTPLRDGMNLVAKEYVAAQNPDDPGVLVLSEMAGAAAELDAAVHVNPYDIEGITQGLNKALKMPKEERKERWQSMMDVLKRRDIHYWQESFLKDLSAAPHGD
ncbi:trehalose-6-phosphate synthase [Marinimicrobium sp. ABcell2]|uniref:alpha,alpha-trehalose-phosphate synthase (UDP-forming) n=1 Tax=Marinimicrobium sp. ABcell2 TaxID=3069751 RepID=UPI0027B137A0|nr:trehalose-6-phosphate synthase [Marinimicrobium sp. ABcell2]MDQ2078435.1 trehalose-6-phosphate synthase [Marinimicrobium sp. ABcell2]